jgi:hypothetical protein
MRHARWAALLTVLSFGPQAQAQVQRGDDQQDRRIARLMDRLRDEMYAYRQELNFFQRAPEYNELVELRYRLRNLAINVADAREGDPQAQRAAWEMQQVARDLYRQTGELEERTDVGAREEVQRRANQLQEHAVEIRVLIGRLHEVVRLDFDGDRGGSYGAREGYQPGGAIGRPRVGVPPGAPIERPGAPIGRPGVIIRPRDPRGDR